MGGDAEAARRAGINVDRVRMMVFMIGGLMAGVGGGMGLLNLASGTRFVITGLVPLAAVLVDALSKRRRAARGVT